MHVFNHLFIGLEKRRWWRWGMKGVCGKHQGKYWVKFRFGEVWKKKQIVGVMTHIERRIKEDNSALPAIWIVGGSTSKFCRLRGIFVLKGWPNSPWTSFLNFTAWNGIPFALSLEWILSELGLTPSSRQNESEKRNDFQLPSHHFRISFHDND